MPDENEKPIEKPETNDSAESKPAETESAVRQEAQEGEKELTKVVTDYVKARKEGLRDKDTQNHLPPQPTFFDSSTDSVKPTIGKVAGEYSLGDIARTMGEAASGLTKALGEGAKAAVESLQANGLPFGDMPAAPGAQSGGRLAEQVSAYSLSDVARTMGSVPGIPEGLGKATQGALEDVRDSLRQLADAASDLTKDITNPLSENEEKPVPRQEHTPSEEVKEAKRIQEMADDPKKNEAKDKLEKSLDSHTPPLSDEQKAEFKKDMQDFEKRAAQKGLPPEEVAKTYEQIGKILDAQGDQPLSPEQRAKIAEGVMEHAAHPTDVNQGQHQTCNVTVVETMMYSKNPAAAAEMMSEIATKGEYTGKDGTHVKLNPLNFKPDAEAKKDPPGPGDRDFASQLFQVTAVNLHLQKSNPNHEYVQRETPLSGQTVGQGEQILDKTTGQVVMSGATPKDFAAGFSTEKMAQTYNQIADKDKTTGKPEHFDVGLTAPPFTDQPVHATAIENEQKLNDTLARLKQENKLPVAVWVHTSGEPFWSDSGGGSAGGAGGDRGGGHYVTVTDYEPGPPAKVAVDNQWGKSSDHNWERKPDGSIDKSKSVSPHDLFIAMHDPADQRDLLKKDVEKNLVEGKHDAVKELDYLRMQRNTDTIDNDKYAKEVAKVIETSHKRWDDQRERIREMSDPDQKARALEELKLEQDRAAEKMKQAINFLPSRDRMEVLGPAAKAGILTPEETKAMLEDTMVVLLEAKAAKIYQGKYDESEKNAYAKFDKQAKEILDKMPEDQRNEVLQKVAARAPKGAPKLSYK